MKVAHLAVVTPGQCGLYETTRELVKGLRERGVDSRIVDPTESTNKHHPGGSGDRGAPYEKLGWAIKADVLVSHSGPGKELEQTDQPLIHVAHGRPWNSFLYEFRNSHPIYSYHYHLNKQARCKAVVTFWPQHEPYLRVMFPETHIRVIQAPVDLDFWKPGSREYDFHGQGGTRNIVCSDMWRDDIDPFVPMNAYALWARQNPGVKLHLYGVKGMVKEDGKFKKGPTPLIKAIQDKGAMGEIHQFTVGLVHAYRAADCLITAHTIDTRSVREAMACGCPVVRIPGPTLNGFCEDIQEGLDQDRAEVRLEAVRRFNPEKTVTQFHRLLKDVA